MLPLTPICFFLLLALYKCVHTSLNDCELWVREHIFNTDERNYMNLTFRVVKFTSFKELNTSCSKDILTDYCINLFPLNEMLLFNHRQMQIQNLIEMFNLNISDKNTSFSIRLKASIKTFCQTTILNTGLDWNLIP